MWQVPVMTLTWLTVILLNKPGSRIRLLANYLAVWALYSGSASLVVALNIPLQHARLLQWDTLLLGGTPSAMIQGRAPVWMNDVLSLGYMSYHVYLHWVLIEAMFRSPAERRHLGYVVFTAFALGLPGYYLFPSAPPASALPELFHGPVSGGWLTEFNGTIDAQLAARFDAFPSLHLLITLALLTCDWSIKRSRFWIMLAPSVLMLAATLVLRLHFASDLLAAVALYFVWLTVIKCNHPKVSDDRERNIEP